MYMALRPVHVAGRSYRVGEAVPAEDLLHPLRLVKAGVLCETPDPPVESDPAGENAQAEPAPKPAKKARSAQKEAGHE